MSRKIKKNPAAQALGSLGGRAVFRKLGSKGMSELRKKGWDKKHERTNVK